MDYSIYQEAAAAHKIYASLIDKDIYTDPFIYILDEMQEQKPIKILDIGASFGSYITRLYCSYFMTRGVITTLDFDEKRLDKHRKFSGCLISGADQGYTSDMDSLDKDYDIIIFNKFYDLKLAYDFPLSYIDAEKYIYYINVKEESIKEFIFKKFLKHEKIKGLEVPVTKVQMPY